MSNIAEALVLAGTLSLTPMPDNSMAPFTTTPITIDSTITYPESVFKDGILWSKALLICERVKLSPYTEKVEEATKICWMVGLKKDGTVIWKEVKE